jgi:hypothetical protein
VPLRRSVSFRSFDRAQGPPIPARKRLGDVAARLARSK